MGERAKILVLDDRKSWRFTINNILKGEYDVVLTNTPEQAKAKMKTGKFDLAILDQKLDNKRTGLEVLSWLRKDSPRLPAIICTAYPTSLDKKAYLKAGALAYLDKATVNFNAKLKRSVRRYKTARTIKVFLSYQHEDRKPVNALFDKLTAEGFLPWMDHRSIIKGEWWPQIEQAIEDSNYFIACFSSCSLHKKKSIFREELKVALSIEKRLFKGEVFFVPVKIAECEIPEAFKHYDFKDVYKKEGFVKLIKALG